MNQNELAYISGFFDGEGSIGVYNRNVDRTGLKRYYVLVVTLSQGGEDGKKLLEAIQESFGGSVSEKKGTNKRMWQLHLSSLKGKSFLETILPYLRLKKEQATLAIQFQNLDIKSTNNKEAIDISNKLKELKR